MRKEKQEWEKEMKSEFRNLNMHRVIICEMQSSRRFLINTLRIQDKEEKENIQDVKHSIF